MSISEYYESYWRNPEPDPDQSQLVAERKALLRAALRGLPDKAKILDLGSGVGAFTAFCNQMGFEASGVDISSNAIQTARARYPQLQFETASVEHGLPFETELFDAVWSSEVLEHLFDVRAALREINRVLKPNGRFVFTTPYHGVLKNLVVSFFYFDRHFDPCGPHIRFFTRESLKHCLTTTGFVVDRWSAVGRFWPVWMSHFVVARKVGAASK